VPETKGGRGFHSHSDRNGRGGGGTHAGVPALVDRKNLSRKGEKRRAREQVGARFGAEAEIEQVYREKVGGKGGRLRGLTEGVTNRQHQEEKSGLLARGTKHLCSRRGRATNDNLRLKREREKRTLEKDVSTKVKGEFLAGRVGVGKNVPIT